MQIWILLGLIFLAGAIGGLINALLTDNGFPFPRMEKVERIRIFRPGALGNILIGAIAAVISWGLYGPFSNIPIAGATEPPSQHPIITLSAFVGAILIGIGGARWLTDEADKRILKAAVRIAANKANPDASTEITEATPVEMIEIVSEL